MATDMESPGRSFTGLMRGILDDTTLLVKQQGRLLRAEIKSDLRKTKELTTIVVAGAVVCGLGSILLSLAAAHLLHELAPRMPLSACYGIVGALLGLAGGLLLYASVKKMRSFSLFPDQSVEALKENVQWMTKSRQSDTR